MKLSFWIGDSGEQEQQGPGGSSGSGQKESLAAVATRHRCYVSVADLVGEESYKERKEKLPKTKSCCDVCDKPCCKGHLTQVCPQCQ